MKGMERMKEALTLESLKSQPITIGLAVALLLYAIASWAWLSTNFVTEAVASDRYDKLSEQISLNTDLFTEHNKQDKIDRAIQDADGVSNVFYYLKRDGADDKTLRIKGNEVEMAENYRDCLIFERPNCEAYNRFSRFSR